MLKLKTFRGKIALSGIIVLFIGVGLLIFTFFTAFGFLSESLRLVTYGDFARLFGEALAPLIAACIRVMYIGIMGWIGSILTIRGITIINNLSIAEVRKIIVTPKLKAKPEQKEPEKERVREPIKKPIKEEHEPEAVIVIPEPVPARQQKSQPNFASPSQQQS
jgi:hypothetical protein